MPVDQRHSALPFRSGYRRWKLIDRRLQLVSASAAIRPNFSFGSNCDLRHRTAPRLECRDEPTFSAERRQCASERTRHCLSRLHAGVRPTPGQKFEIFRCRSDNENWRRVGGTPGGAGRPAVSRSPSLFWLAPSRSDHARTIPHRSLIPFQGVDHRTGGVRPTSPR